eukprot:gene7020-7382_t
MTSSFCYSGLFVGGGGDDGGGEADDGGGGGGLFGSLIASATQLTADLASKAELLADSALSDFQNEQRKFVNSKGAGAPPWVGMSNEGELKEKILALSVDERNFVRDPPAGQNSSVDLKENMGMAMAILAEDSALEEMRFKLVPKTCTEDRFWGNYFLVDCAICWRGLNGSNLEAPVVASVDVSELGGPSQEVGVDPAEQEGDLSDHELEEFEDGNVYAADSRDGAGGAAIDLSALGANVGFPTSTAADADADVEALPAAQEEANDEMEELEEPEEDEEGQEGEAALQPSSSPSPADEAPSPDDDWEKELADELNDFELVDGEDGELDDADLEDLDGMLDDVESTD